MTRNLFPDLLMMSFVSGNSSGRVEDFILAVFMRFALSKTDTELIFTVKYFEGDLFLKMKANLSSIKVTYLYKYPFYSSLYLQFLNIPLVEFIVDFP